MPARASSRAITTSSRVEADERSGDVIVRIVGRRDGDPSPAAKPCPAATAVGAWRRRSGQRDRLGARDRRRLAVAELGDALVPGADLRVGAEHAPRPAARGA